MTSRSKEASQKAINKCKNRCVICGWEHKDIDNKPLVQGCHIYDYSKEKKYDEPSNIIALCPNHHTEMDRYSFYIEPKSHTYHHFDSSDAYNNMIVDIEYVNDEYLAYRMYHTLQAWQNKLKKK